MRNTYAYRYRANSNSHSNSSGGGAEVAGQIHDRECTKYDTKIRERHRGFNIEGKAFRMETKARGKGAGGGTRVADRVRDRVWYIRREGTANAATCE